MRLTFRKTGDVKPRSRGCIFGLRHIATWPIAKNSPTDMQTENSLQIEAVSLFQISNKKKTILDWNTQTIRTLRLLYYYLLSLSSKKKVGNT